MNWNERITVDSKILVGKPVIKGTRLAVDFIVELLAQGWTTQEIMKEYPGLIEQDVQACILFAKLGGR